MGMRRKQEFFLFAGTGCLICHIQSAGAQDILAVDVAPKMLAILTSRYGKPPLLGNTQSVRTWLGDICELPNYLGRADVVFMNAVFGNLLDPKAALLKCCSLLKDRGCIVISHPLGAFYFLNADSSTLRCKMQ
jgi:SAM-dependent methyltransferase